MKKFTQEYKDFMFESLNDKVGNKLTEKYKSLKANILLLLDSSIKDTTELINVQNFINAYIENPEKSTLVDFVDDAQIFDFYLKTQSNIDELCNDTNFFDEIPKTKNIFSLYNYIIEGTKFAVLEAMKIMQKELF